MGVGDPLEAGIQIESPIAAGSWSLVGDGIILAPVDMRFDVLRRRPGTPPGDQMIATFNHHFDPPAGGGFNAVPFDGSANGSAADVQKGDQLILRFTATSQSTTAPYIPNGDGASTMGRIPSLTLPK